MTEHSTKKRQQGASPSRRGFLKTTFAGALLAGAFTVSEAQAKVSKSAANYRDSPRGNQRCSGCRFFVSPDSCKRVAGDISPNAWCTYYRM
jgi:hypothetical protein